MSISNPAPFVDANALRAALVDGDAQTLIGFYADDADLQVVDHLHQPSKPLVLHGKEAIAAYWQDVCGRAMTHDVERIVVSENALAYSERCRYPDGTQVRCIAMLDLRDGKIAQQIGVQAWDE